MRLGDDRPAGLLTESEAVAYMGGSLDEEDWHRRSDSVKGDYFAMGKWPRYWFSAIIKSDLFARTEQSWIGAE